MLIFPDQRLVYFAVPKTGTTAFEMTMREAVPGCIALAPDRKHMNVRSFEHAGANLTGVEGIWDFERFAVLREPLDRLASWYRYRRRLSLDEPKSTANINFAEFVEATLVPDPPPSARTGNQFKFVTRGDHSIGIDHLFAIEQPALFASFLQKRFGDLPDFGRLNVSAPANTDLSKDLRQRLYEARQQEFDLHAEVACSGHRLEPRG